jgi:hypothetical protein
MARIRTVKPEFFRHEGLQDLEVKYPKKYPMLVFAGLWTSCDKNGRFEWRPRQLKLDILPFIPFDMDETLSILKAAGFIFIYEVSGKAFGIIPTFNDHQRITGKEAQAPGRYPDPPGNYQGSNRETPEEQPGNNRDDLDAQEKEKEKEKEKERTLCVYTDAFLSFWKIYPKKTAKKGAFAEWEKARTTGLLPSIDVILPAIENQKRAKQKALDTGQFTSEWPDPERWIKKARWEDDPESLIGKTGGNNGANNGRRNNNQGRSGLPEISQPPEWKGDPIPKISEEERQANITRARSLARSLGTGDPP